MITKWFMKSSFEPKSKKLNDRFAERLDNVWFKVQIGGFVRLGKFLTNLNERVTKLEKAALRWPTDSYTIQGATGRRTSSTVYRTNIETANYSVSSDPNVLVRAVERFKRNDKATVSFVYHDGLRITIERDTDV